MVRKKAVIEGLFTEGSMKKVKDSLSSLENVTSVSVERELAVIEGDTSDDDIVKAVEEAGFNVNMLQEI
ncbi:heavy-metal-associated domain-containing protein [Clostridium polynesiense]|uniref:heavy-metal-associated domain-containing protein n=1 Tax=Clostridium polynesiense TaxID=1325933 RepID=UPI00058C46A4|nr:heavy metal-associated domain-containing protein [Clostridium polynesiense]